MSPSLLFDNSIIDISYHLGWSDGSDPSSLGGTYKTCQVDPSTVNTPAAPTKMIVTFTGRKIEFLGQPADNFKHNYSLDRNASIPAVSNFKKGFSGKTGILLWSFDDFTAGVHNLALFPTAGQPIFDYAVVTPTNSTSLEGATLVVDDTDTLINFSDKTHWTSDSGTRFSAGLSFNSTRTGTNKPGSSFTFDFVGSSISVFGLLNQQSGRLSSSYSIDGGPATTHVAYDGSQASKSDSWVLHQRFFQQDVSPGSHNLTVTVLEVTGNQMYWLDYMTFVGTADTRVVASKGISKAALAGGLIGAFISFAALFWCMRRFCCRGRPVLVYV